MELRCDWRALQEILPVPKVSPNYRPPKADAVLGEEDLLKLESYWEQVKAARGAEALGFLERLVRWRRWLPDVFGVYLAFEGTRGFFMSFRRGRLQDYFVPDLSGLSPERARSTEEVVRYLSEN